MLNLVAAGRCGKDGILKYTADGTPLLSFSVGTDVGFGDKKHVVWVNCTMWGKRGESLHPYIKKGGSVTVSGEADLREWKSDTSSGTSLELRVGELTLQGGGNTGDNQQSATESNQGGFRNKPAQVEGGFEDSDLPF